MKQPMQPIYEDEHGVTRFHANAIVKRLLDEASNARCCDLCRIAMWDVSPEDQEQFAQLIGYSLGGFAELSYVRNKTYAAAMRAAARLTNQP